MDEKRFHWSVETSWLAASHTQHKQITQTAWRNGQSMGHEEVHTSGLALSCPSPVCPCLPSQSSYKTSIDPPFHSRNSSSSSHPSFQHSPIALSPPLPSLAAFLLSAYLVFLVNAQFCVSRLLCGKQTTETVRCCHRRQAARVRHHQHRPTTLKTREIDGLGTREKSVTNLRVVRLD